MKRKERMQQLAQQRASVAAAAASGQLQMDLAAEIIAAGGAVDVSTLSAEAIMAAKAASGVVDSGVMPGDESSRSRAQLAERLRAENRERKRRWREQNAERNRDNDLRGRVLRRANKIFGPEMTEQKERWIREEWEKRRSRRVTGVPASPSTQHHSRMNGGMMHHHHEDVTGATEGMVANAMSGFLMDAATVGANGGETSAELIGALAAAMLAAPASGNVLNDATNASQGVSGLLEDGSTNAVASTKGRSRKQ